MKLSLISVVALLVIPGIIPETRRTCAQEEKKIDVERLYRYYCATCHGNDGSGTRRGHALKAPNFKNPEWQESITDEEILHSIMYGKNKMPRWSDKLEEEEIHALAKYVRKLAPGHNTE